MYIYILRGNIKNTSVEIPLNRQLSLKIIHRKNNKNRIGYIYYILYFYRTKVQVVFLYEIELCLNMTSHHILKKKIFRMI